MSRLVAIVLLPTIAFAGPTVAEGVETEEQLEALKRLGCDKVQGYLLGRPGSEIQFVDQVRTGRRAASVG